MSKYTPGPWKIRKFYIDGATEIFADVNFMLGADTAGANARLIAAAPEMLECLRRLKTFLTEYGDDFKIQTKGIGIDIMVSEWIQNCLETLAKAEAGK